MKLANEVAIFVPSTFGESSADPALIARIIDQALVELSSVNGGATVTNGIGAWIASDGKLIKEEVTIVSSNCGEVTPQTLRTLAKLRRFVRESMEQEAVTIRVNGTLYIR